MIDRSVKTPDWLPAVLCLCLLLCSLVSWSQTTNFSTFPSADAFVRAHDPTNNFGHAGALAVSGALAQNLSGQKNGEFDSLIRFPTSGLKASLDSTLGANNWTITLVALRLSEESDPNNPMFNTGVGAFEIRWLASTNWTEGSGTPRQVRTEGVTYQQVPALLNPLTDVSLGQFTNPGADLHLTFPLPLLDVLVTNILNGTPLNLYFSPVSPTVGFTFYSRNFPIGSFRSALNVTAEVSRPALVPVIQSIALAPSNQVAIYFNVTSNTTCQLQANSSFLSPGGWSSIFTATPALTNQSLVVYDTVTNSQTFYRLLTAP